MNRDVSRDVEREVNRDRNRDVERDGSRDVSRGAERDESRDVSRGVSLGVRRCLHAEAAADGLVDEARAHDEHVEEVPVIIYTYIYISERCIAIYNHCNI